MNIIPSRYETLPPNTTSVLGSRVLTLLQSCDEEKEENEVKELNGKKQLAKNLFSIRLTYIFHRNFIFLASGPSFNIKKTINRQFTMPLKLFSFRCTVVRSLERKFKNFDLTNHRKTWQSGLQLSCDWLKKDCRTTSRQRKESIFHGQKNFFKFLLYYCSVPSVT